MNKAFLQFYLKIFNCVKCKNFWHLYSLSPTLKIKGLTLSVCEPKVNFQTNELNLDKRRFISSLGEPFHNFLKKLLILKRQNSLYKKTVKQIYILRIITISN